MSGDGARHDVYGSIGSCALQQIRSTLRSCMKLFKNVRSICFLSLPAKKPSQITRWSRNLRQMIPIERLHNLPQSLMTIILLIPHILMVFYFPLLIQRQCHKAVDRLREVHHAWRVFLLHLEGKLGVGIGDNFCGECARGGHDFWYAFYLPHISPSSVDEGIRWSHTIPLSSNLIPRIAVTPRVIIDSLLRIYQHILLARTP